MHGADAGAGVGGDQRFRDHRHVDDDAIALADAELDQRARELCDQVAEFAIGVGADDIRCRAVVDDRRLLTPAGIDMPVERVVAGIGDAAAEPAVERLVRVVENLVPLLEPMYFFGSLAPETLRVLDRPVECFLIFAGHCPPSLSLAELFTCGAQDGLSGSARLVASLVEIAGFCKARMQPLITNKASPIRPFDRRAPPPVRPRPPHRRGRRRAVVDRRTRRLRPVTVAATGRRFRL